MKVVQAYQVIGHSERRSDGEEKVTGKAIYTVDVSCRGWPMERFFVVRTRTRDCAELTRARRRNFPAYSRSSRATIKRRFRMFGAAYKDQTIVAVDKVRYAGDPVAAVAAVDEATADAALALIEIDYEELPAVTDLDVALAPSAPLVHEVRGERRRIDGPALRSA